MAWLYLPDMEDLNSDSVLRLENITEQSPTLRGSLRQPRYWQRIWEKDGWTRLLSGMTLQPSQGMSLAHSWIESTLSQRVSPVSHFHLPQEKEKELRMSDSSGTIFSELFARYDRESCSWKMSQASFAGKLWNTSLPTWTQSGSLRNGAVFVRPPLAHRTEGKESSFVLPTPTAREWKDISQSKVLARLDNGVGVAKRICSLSLMLRFGKQIVGLNPCFGEWMMGLRPGWTDYASSETE